MSTPVHCLSCGHDDVLPADYARPRFRCVNCGAMNEAPPQAVAPPRAAKAVTPRFDLFGSEPAAAAVKAPVVPAPPGERELLIQGTDNEDDYNPYTVLGDVPTGTCPACNKPMYDRLTICKNCGADLIAKSKAERTFEPIDRTWENGWPLTKRLTLFAALQVINVGLLVAPFVTGQSTAWYFSGSLINLALQAFLLGTFDSLRLTRSTKGKVALAQTWRCGFIARKPQTIRWKDCEGVRIVESTEHSTFDWMIGILLFTYGIVPGIVFWRYVLGPNILDVALCKDHGNPAIIICRTTNKERAAEIMKAVSEAAVLPVLS